MEKEASPHLSLAKSFWKNHLKPEDLAIDATCGNGHDTKFLKTLCHVVGLDIQKQALENTRIRLGGEKAELYLLSHEFIDSLNLNPNLIVYNLGYLPSGDKSITTKVESTLISVEKGLKILKSGGALSITCYPGHIEGGLEEKRLVSWAESLPSSKWMVSYHRWLNRVNSPTLLWIKDRMSPCLPTTHLK